MDEADVEKTVLSQFYKRFAMAGSDKSRSALVSTSSSFLHSAPLNTSGAYSDPSKTVAELLCNVAIST